MIANTNETLELVKTAQGQPNDELAKSITVSTGLVAYDLQAPSLKLFPVITPLRNKLPRVKGAGDTATRWKAITAINAANQMPGVSEGNRGGTISTTVVSKTAAYAGIGLEDSVTFEADYASQTFEDVKATAGMNLLRATMIAEEKVILGGNNSLALGTTPTPSLTGSNSGGALAAATNSVICVALTHAGWLRASVASGVTQQVTRTNADGSSDTINAGVAQKSANATATTTGSAGSIAATVAAVAGAVAYAWYVGAAGSEKLAYITTVNAVTITALNGSGQLASALTAADYSQDSLVFDGLLTVAATSANNAYRVSLDNAVLTSDGAGGIAEFTTAFQSFYDNYKVSPDTIWVSSQEAINITKKVVANGGAPLFRITQAAEQAHDGISAGARVTSVLNPVTGQMVVVAVHPNMPQGTALFSADTIPYPISGVGNVMQVKTRREYYQLEWPLKSRKYEYGVYVDELLQHYAPFTLGIMSNIKNG